MQGNLIPHRTEQLRQILPAGLVVSIHHIGSPSVEGLPAKPVIDMLLEVSDVKLLDSITDAMETLGYSARGGNGIVGRRYFTKDGTLRTHQLHAFNTGDQQVVNHLAFRNYLAAKPRVAAEYARIKRQAVAICQNDAQRYAALKHDFIVYHLQLALTWQLTHSQSEEIWYGEMIKPKSSEFM